MLIIKKIKKIKPIYRLKRILHKNKISDLNSTMPELIHPCPPPDTKPLQIDYLIKTKHNIENFNLSDTVFECLTFYMIIIVYIIAATINKVLLTVDKYNRNK